MLFDQAWLPKFGWTTLEQERINAVFPYIDGLLLDIGAGTNTLVKLYGRGVGVDVINWHSGALLIEDSARLPFKDNQFDTITFVACLNHIPNRIQVISEVKRLIKKDGKMIITMINPILGNIGHALWWYSEDKKRGGMKDGELGGMWSKEVIEICERADFLLISHHRFLFGLNNLYIFSQK